MIRTYSIYKNVYIHKTNCDFCPYTINSNESLPRKYAKKLADNVGD
jgi:hypothetical protein